MVEHIAGRAGIWDKVEMLEEHLHGTAKVYPTLADGVTLTCTSGATTWTLGTVVEVVAASAIGSDFDIHHISVEGISANGVFEVVLYSGAGDTEVGRVRFTRNAIQSATQNAPMMTPIIAKDSRIRAAVASDDDNGQTVVISLFYHVY